MLNHNKSLRININWRKSKVKYDVYKRWVDLWKED